MKRRRRTSSQDLGDPGLDPGCQGSDVERTLDAKLRRSGYWFDAREADRVCRFFEEHLHHVEGEWRGTPVILADWQRRRIRRQYGWRRPDGTRRYRRAHYWVPKKNGKSLLLSGMCLFATCCDGEPGARVFNCAKSEEQARLVFGVASEMVRMSPMLSECCEIFKRSIFCHAMGSRYEVLSATPGSKHGLNIHCIGYDEIHAAGDRELYDVLTMGSGSARRQPLELVISTAGNDIGSIGYELFEYALKVIDGTIEDPEFMATVYAAGPEDDWREPATWAKANPTYPVSPKHEALASDAKKAEGMPSAIAAFKQLHLNIWTQRAEAAIDITRWKKCQVAKLRPRKKDGAIAELLRGRRCWGGLDLASTQDLTSFSLVFPRDGGGADSLTWHWVPEDNVAERAKRDRVDYPKWIQTGDLFATPGNVVDYSRIEQFIVDIRPLVDLQDVGYDPRNATDLVQRLQDNHAITMVEVLPSYKNLSAATKCLERLYLSRQLGHTGSPVMIWQASHVVWRTNATGDIMPDKKRSREKIDGIASLVTAIARMMAGAGDVSQLETTGLVVI